MTTLFTVSNQCFNVASVLYALAFVLYAGQLVSSKALFSKVGPWMARAAYLAHTTALVVRWMDAGIAHPPWTNLYESLVFFSWGIMGVHVLLEYRFGFKLTGVFATGVVFAAMGVASLHPHKEIEPLVPALQSWWLLFHVFMACIAYAFFLASSFVSVFYLVKDKVRVETMAGFAALVCVLFLCIAAGKSFFTTGEIQFFKVTKMQAVDGVLREVIMDFRGPDGKPMQQFVSLPGALYIFWPLLGLYLSSAACLLTSAGRRRKQHEALGGLRAAPVGADVALDAMASRLDRVGRLLFYGALAVHLGLLADVFVATSTQAEMALKSNPYRVASIGMTLAIAAFFAFLFQFRTRVYERLPSLDVLDRWSYESILLGVPFMTINLISGAVWAYYAWGRYWGWDPKETWALITWFTYVIYLHLRMFGGWKGRKTALISILGFFVVIFTYLGVNLVISGLHSYATS